MTKNNSNLDALTRQLKDTITNLADSSDIEALVESGILKKDGAWFKVVSLNCLPEKVSKKIKDIKPTKDGVLVKFENCKHFKKLAEKIGA